MNYYYYYYNDDNNIVCSSSTSKNNLCCLYQCVVCNDIDLLLLFIAFFVVDAVIGITMFNVVDITIILCILHVCAYLSSVSLFFCLSTVCLIHPEVVFFFYLQQLYAFISIVIVMRSISYAFQ